MILEINHSLDSFDLLIDEHTPHTFNYSPFIKSEAFSKLDISSVNDIEVEDDDLFSIDHLLEQRENECIGNPKETFDGDTYLPYCLNNEEDALHAFHVLPLEEHEVCMEPNT
jgi:hypothetical protein